MKLTFTSFKRFLEYRIVAAIIILCINFLFILWLFNTNFLASWNNRLTDNLYERENKTSEDIIIVAIDDKSLTPQEQGGLGRWQEWDRDYYAGTISNLNTAGARVVGLDVLFLDVSENTEADLELARVVQESNNVFIASKFDFESNTFLKPQSIFYGGDESKLGFINILVDPDNTVRKKLSLS